MKGFSLFEVLIALFLTSIAMLNFMQQKIKITTSLQQIYFNDVALQQALSVVERLRVNQNANYRMQEIINWNIENNVLLPQGEGKIKFHEKTIEILICWKIKLKQCLTINLLF